MATQKTLLRHVRREREIALHALARRVRVSASMISRAERGLIGLNQDAVERIAKALGVAPEALLKPYNSQQAVA